MKTSFLTEGVTALRCSRGRPRRHLRCLSSARGTSRHGNADMSRGQDIAGHPVTNRHAKFVVSACLTACTTALLVGAPPASAVIPGYEVVEVINQPVGAGATGAAVATCSAGKRVLGGGVYTGHDAMRLIESFPQLGNPPAWSGAVFNGGLANFFNVYAICANLPAGNAYEVVGVVNQPVPASGAREARALCPVGKRVLGGGVYTGHNAMRLIESFPQSGVPSAWRGAVFNGGPASVFDVYAICARLADEDGYQVVPVVNQPVQAGATTGVAPLCPGGKRALGGGVDVAHAAMRLIESFPLGGNAGWLGSVFNGGAASVYGVYAICAFAVP
jgi:hypothetical protein